MSSAHTPNMDAYWIPFTPNREFKKNPRLFSKAKGMYLYTPEGREVLDGLAGLWCVNAGHCRPEIIGRMDKQMRELDYAPAFQASHPLAFELSERLVKYMPDSINHVFYANSGSESVETALKIALAYQNARGQGGRYRLIGREKGYHGVNFGGISVGGLPANRKTYGPLLSGVDHLPHTHGLAENFYSKGEPKHGGVALAENLERIVTTHDASTIAAVIVEPMAGSAGVLIPPLGYLKRLREICDKHDILLIFDEVITGFGRLGKPFATDYFGVVPDIITSAKGLTSGAVPMGAVFVSDKIHAAFMKGPEHLIELFHGYTYSGNPLACAAAMGALDAYEADGLFERKDGIYAYFEQQLHSLKGLPHVIDIRNIGLVGAIELEPIAGHPTKRAFAAFLKALDAGLLIRTTGDIIALSPPLIISKAQIDTMVGILRDVLQNLDQSMAA
jgi:beta-alanine--pyruvate transaminase